MTLYPLTGTFPKVAAAVQPQVYTLSGRRSSGLAHTDASITLPTGAGRARPARRPLRELDDREQHAPRVHQDAASLELLDPRQELGNLGGIIGGVL